MFLVFEETDLNNTMLFSFSEFFPTHTSTLWASSKVKTKTKNPKTSQGHNGNFIDGGSFLS